MKHGFQMVMACALVPALGGCIARTAVDVVTAPVKVVSKGVDMATTSQSEADEKRGRELRKREEQLGKLERAHARESERCNQGSEEACARADALAGQIADLSPSVPVPRR